MSLCLSKLTDLRVILVEYPRHIFIAAILVLASFALLASTASAAVGSSLVISEFRFLGYFGGNDEYIELYNNSDSDIVVNASDGSSGWTVAEYGGFFLHKNRPAP